MRTGNSNEHFAPRKYKPVFKQVLVDSTAAIVVCPVDYIENMKLTKKLKELVSPI